MLACASDEVDPPHQASLGVLFAPSIVPPLRVFFLVMCLALISSSILGVWIAFTSTREQKLHVGLLVAGFVLPAVLMLV